MKFILASFLFLLSLNGFEPLTSIDLVQGKWIESNTDLTTFGKKPVELKRTFHAGSRDESYIHNWNFNLPDLGKVEPVRRKMTAPQDRLLEYVYDEDNKLTKLTIAKDQDIEGWFEIEYEKNRCKILSNAGDFVIYGFTSNSLLKYVEKSDGKRCEYEYIPHPLERSYLIAEKREANGNWLKFSYDKLGKISDLFCSYDGGGSYVRTCHFEYKPDMTSVLDAKGVLYKYYYNEDSQIEKIETFLEDCGLYRIQELEWHNDRLIRKTNRDGANNLLNQQRWVFDTKKNLIEEHLKGSLSRNGSAIESHKRTYRYDNQNRLIEEQEENGLKITYAYNGQRSEKLVWDDDQIVERTFYFYDDENRLIKTLTDDNGTTRTFEKKNGFNPFDSPLEITKGIVDSSTGEEVIQECVSYLYDEKGRVIRESTLNDEISTSYQEDGSILEVISKNHHILFSPSVKRVYGPNGETIFTYSEQGKLLKEEVIKEGRLISSHSYIYDSFFQVIAKIENGNVVTSYEYDCLGRKIKETLPAVLGVKDELVTNSIYTTYDPLDRVIRVENPEEVINTTYNARGQPFFIDGKEKWYTKGGRLERETYKDGTYQAHTYDNLGRIKQKTLLSPLDEVIFSQENIYFGSYLSKEIFSSGITLEHSYNSFGFKTESFCPETGRKITYDYDEDGKLLFQKEWVDSNHSIVKEPHQNSIDPSHESMQLDFVQNSLNQTVLQKTLFNPDGSSMKILHDALHRPERVDYFLPNGVLISTTHLRHDFKGRKIQETVDLIQEARSLTNSWQYDSDGNLIKQIEACGSLVETTTSYQYNAAGKLISEIHADGTRLYYEYDSKNRLSSLSSDDGALHYELIYNQEGRVELIKDHVSHLETKRSYSLDGDLISETLGNGLTIQNTYDRIGRRTCLVLPGLGTIHTRFEGKDLVEISRNDPQGNLLYSSQMTSNSLDMIEDLGKITYERTEKGRLKSIHSPYFEQKATFDNQDRLTSLETTDPNGYYVSNFAYLPSEGIKEDSQTHRFDPLGNPRSYAVNALNQIFDEGDLEYDLKGNLIKKVVNGSIFAFSYDPFNRLKKVRKDGKLIHRYTYDLYHRRLMDASCGVKYIYDGNQEIGTTDANGTIRELRVFDGKSTCIAFELDQVLYAPIYNLLGSVAVLVDVTTKEAVSSYRYNAFGITSDGLSPWQFSNKRHDDETGLLDFGRRDYDPTLGRFISKDPLGFIDGPNRYAYCRNDPLNLKDPFGLQAEEDGWEEFKQNAREFFEGLGDKILSCFQSLKDNSNLGLRDVFEHSMGNGVILLTGYNATDASSGFYGQGEVSDKVRISFINGILTTHNGLSSALQELSESHGNVNIHYVYRPTKGWVRDILHSFAVKLGLVSEQAQSLATLWQRMIGEMGGVDNGGKIIHYAHSIGAVETVRALALLTEAEQKLIHIYAFGSPSLGEENPHQQTYHFVSIRDGVPLLSLPAYIQACTGTIPNVVFLGHLYGFPFIDHLFRDQTYLDLWKSMGKTFVDWYGTIPN